MSTCLDGIPCTPPITCDGKPADGPDSDKDGIADKCDNCPKTANADQRDSDKDGIGDLCDRCPTLANIDLNHDGILECPIVVITDGTTGKDLEDDFNT